MPDAPGSVNPIYVSENLLISLLPIAHNVCLPMDSEIVCGQDASQVFFVVLSNLGRTV